jgi:hypothetical protein
MNDEIHNCGRPAMIAAKLLLRGWRGPQSRGVTILRTARSLARTRLNLQRERVL